MDLTVGKRIVVSDTIVSRKDMLLAKSLQSEHKEIRLVYAAAPSHSGLFDKYIGPIIPKLYKRYGDRICFTFISVHPKIDNVQVEYVRGMPLLEYRNYMKNHHFDIGLAPLLNDEFSKCKYFNKFLEYTTQGIVGIYSNTEPYTYAVDNMRNGLLADNNPDSWYETICLAIDNQKLREICLQNAIEDVKIKHSEKACIGRIISDVPEIINPLGRQKKCHDFRFYRIGYYLLRPFDWFYLVFFYLRKVGIKGVAERIKIHFVEAKAYSRRKIK